MNIRGRVAKAAVKRVSASWLIPVLVFLSVAVESSALEKIESDRYRAACQAYASRDGDSDDEALCTAFLLGYLSAVERVSLTRQEDRTYHDRAAATRAKGLIYKDKRLKGKRYCVPEDEPLERFIGRINEVAVSRDSSPYAENVIETVLDKYYRCAG